MKNKLKSLYKYLFLGLTILLGLFALIVLPSCGQKDNPLMPTNPIIKETQQLSQPHHRRQGQRIAVSTRRYIQREARPYTDHTDLSTTQPADLPLGSSSSMYDDPSSSDRASDRTGVYIEDVSIQEHRLEGQNLIATLKIHSNGQEAEIDLMGVLLQDGTADMFQITPNPLVVGVALCLDTEDCLHVVLDIYYRDLSGQIVRYQVESITPTDDSSTDDSISTDVDDTPTNIDSSPREEVDDSHTTDRDEGTRTPSQPDIHEIPASQTPERPSVEQVKVSQEVTSPPYTSQEGSRDDGHDHGHDHDDDDDDNDDVPQPVHASVLEEHAEEGGDELPAEYANRPPTNIQAIQRLPIPTADEVKEQNQQTRQARERIHEGVSVEAIQEEIRQNIGTDQPEVLAPLPSQPLVILAPNSQDMKKYTDFMQQRNARMKTLLNQMREDANKQEYPPPTPEDVSPQDPPVTAQGVDVVSDTRDASHPVSSNPDVESATSNPNVQSRIPQPVITTEEKFDVASEAVEVQIAMGMLHGPLIDGYRDELANGAVGQDQARGMRSGGRLNQGVPLIDAVHGIKWIDYSQANIEKRFVASITNYFFRTIGPYFKRAFPNHFIVVNRSSLRHGGKMRGHKTHQNGLDLDIAYPHANPQTQRFWSVYNGREFIMTERDAQLTMYLLQVMSSTNIVNKYHVDQKVKDYLVHLAERDGKLKEQCPVLTQLCPISGHHNHIHVQLKCTQFNPRCRQSADPPYGSCPMPRACRGI